MKLTGEFWIDGSVPDVWRVIMEPDLLCQVAPRCEEARRLDPTHYEGSFAAKLQFFTVRARVHGELLQVEAPHHFTVDLVGETFGLAGTFRGRAALDLSPDGSGTHARYTFDMNLLGGIGRLGEPLIRLAAQRVTRKFANNVSMFLQSGALPEGMRDATREA